MSEEIWKPIVGYEGYYEISNCGRVKSLRTSQNNLLKIGASKAGSARAELVKNGVVKSKLLNRLILRAFSPNLFIGSEEKVFYKDNNKRNNILENIVVINKKEIYRNYIGKRYGKLTIISLYSYSKHLNYTKFLCKCDCGKDKIASFAYLKYKKEGIVCVPSCGCDIRARPVKSNGDPITQVYTAYQGRARQKKILFDLSKNDFQILIKQNCHYCNSVPSRERRNRKFPDDILIYNGIDRINNKHGYLKNNCVACCTTCNYAKAMLSEQEFLNHIKKIYNFRIKND